VHATELEVLDLEVPEMDDDLQACQRDAGCTGFSVSSAPYVQVHVPKCA
jgi:hypothetical protein